jgi:hypothetical protein
MVLGESLLEVLSSLGSWALADLFRKPAQLFVLVVDPNSLVMVSNSGEEVFRLRAQLCFVRDQDGRPELRAVGNAPPSQDGDEVTHASLSQLFERKDLSEPDVEALVAALLSVCGHKLRERLGLPSNRRVRVNVHLHPELEFADRTFALASLRRSRDAMKRQIPDFTIFRIPSG